jgi:hypothetical protein
MKYEESLLYRFGEFLIDVLFELPAFLLSLFH